jgi:predicted Zn-dependent protease
MNAKTDNNTGDLKMAVSNAMRLLSEGETELAREQAAEILQQFPGEVNSQLVVAVATRERGNSKDAVEELRALVRRVPDFALAHQELGFALAESGQTAEAIDSLRQAVSIESRMPAAWKLMGELHLIDGDEDSASEAINQFLLASSENPALVAAVEEFKAGKIAKAEQICRKFLFENPSNVDAIRLLADIGVKVGVLDDAENLLERCLELAPDFHLARLNYATVLSKREKLEKALNQADHLLEVQPQRKFNFLLLRASILVKMGDYDGALGCYEYLLSNYEPRAMVTLSYAHALKTVGRQEDAIAAYRRTITLKPSFGDAYWSLANLKTFRFEDDEIEAMRTEINRDTITQEDHFHLCFALGKALEDRKQFDESFSYYHLGNDIKEKLEGYDRGKNRSAAQRVIAVCTEDLLSSKANLGDPAPDPIFIVGLPRSGSTLLEQILASHSQVDGTKELVEILSIVRRLSGKKKKSDVSRYPDILQDLDASQLKDLGQEYIDRTRIQRGNGAFFIDKMPNNFLHIGLIHLILPNAKIIDARRHAMAACFSGFTQLFASGQRFTYGLSNIGSYYRDYVDVMDHWDLVLPGRVLPVQYEDVVADAETQIRRILDYCDLPFEEACLQFHRTERAVRTASSEQVRQPIYSGALEHWRNYERHLDELKESLGPVLERYPID